MKKILNFIAYSPHFYLIFILLFFGSALVFGISENLNKLFFILCVSMTILMISDSVKFFEIFNLKKEVDFHFDRAQQYLHSNCILQRRLRRAKSQIKYYESKITSELPAGECQAEK